MDSPRRNLELKAVDPDPQRSLMTCEDLEAEPKGVLLQTDIYFNVPKGRLKLRRENDAVDQLIAYQRSDRPGHRESSYRLVEVEKGSELESALTSVLGVRAVVRKTRQLFLFEGVRIHLDRVDGLGNFIEFEAVAGDAGVDLGRFEMTLADLRRSFGIEDLHLVGESYADLVRADGRSR
jgi:adenylate cyclase class IV